MSEIALTVQPPPAATIAADSKADGAVLSPQSVRDLANGKANPLAIDAFTEADIASTVEVCRQKGFLGEQVTLAWRDLYWTVDDEVLLNAASGYLFPGEMVAVMGDRATNLLQVLADQNANGTSSGQVLINGNPKSEEPRYLSVGFIPTDDFHLPTLTVRETINFSSQLRALPTVSSSVRAARTELIMKMLGLSRVADSAVGNEVIRGISGGEKRRLSIAVELAAGHSCLLASKPTNGLDSATAMDLILKTRELCKAGNSAMYSIVQASPELLNCFDRVICLSRGTLVYFGPPRGADAHFQSLGFRRPATKSIPDFVNEVLATPGRFYHPAVPRALPALDGSNQDVAQPDKVEAKEISFTYTTRAQSRVAWKALVDGFEQSKAHEELGQTLWTKLRPKVELPSSKDSQEAPRTHNAPILDQLRDVSHREWLTFIRNPDLIGGFFGSAIFMGIIFGLTFFDLNDTQAEVRGRTGILFFLTVGVQFDSMVFIPAIMTDARGVFYTQKKAGYFSALVYYAVYALQSIPMAALRQFLLTLIVYPMIDLHDGVFSGSFWYLVFTSILVLLIAKTIILALCFASPNVTVAQTIVPVTFLIYMMSAGFLVQESAAPAGWKWFFSISYARTACAGAFMNEFFYDTATYTCKVGESCLYRSGKDVLAFYDFATTDGTDKYDQLGWLAIYWLFFNVVAAASLLIFDYSGEDSIAREADSPTVEREVSLKSHAGAIQIEEAPVVEFSKLSYSVQVPNPDEATKKQTPMIARTLLSDINGYARPGRMVALMGASGAGKSTLLDVLAGKKTGGEATGKILINGQPKDAFFGRYSGYVEQFDSHVPHSTVREAIEFSAAMRLNETEESRAVLVSQVIKELGLEPWQHHFIGASGEGGIPSDIRKKVTIGVELVLKPGILFLDEPTTGLSSADATSVMEVTRNLANRITVICTIHQPSQEVMDKFDDIVLLQPGGRVIYFGPLDDLPSYFEREGLGKYEDGTNVADFALEALNNRTQTLLASPVAGQPEQKELADPADLWVASEEYKQTVAALSAGTSPKASSRPVYEDLFANSFGTQFWLLLQREVQIRLRDHIGIGARLMTAFFSSILLGTIYWQLPSETGLGQFTADNNRISLAMFVVAIPCYMAQAIIGSMIAHRPVYFRETTNGMYNGSAFYFARLVADLPIQFVMGFITAILTFWIADASPNDQAANFGLWFLGCIVTQMLGVAINETAAMAMPNGELAVNFAVMILSLAFVFSGFLLVRDSIPSYLIWLNYFNAFTWPVYFFVSVAIGDTANGPLLLELFGINTGDRALYFVGLIAHIVFYRIAAFLALTKVQHIKR